MTIETIKPNSNEMKDMEEAIIAGKRAKIDFFGVVAGYNNLEIGGAIVFPVPNRSYRISNLEGGLERRGITSGIDFTVDIIMTDKDGIQLDLDLRRFSIKRLTATVAVNLN